MKNSRYTTSLALCASLFLTFALVGCDTLPTMNPLTCLMVIIFWERRLQSAVQIFPLWQLTPTLHV